MKAKISAALLALVLALPSTAAMAQDVPASRAEISMSFAPVVKQTAPAVVNVYAQRRVAQQGFNPFGDDPFFRRFFGDDGFFGAPRERVQNSLGSGVIVDAGGLIVTNNHVIKGGTDIRVVLSDKREFEAKVVLADERTDLAILRINPGNARLPVVPFGDSDALEVGDLVLAIGNPFGVGQTVTSGIVSALSRTQVGITDYQFFIQTDAAINPGNSGGALIDMAGRLVGINTAIFSRSGGSIGIGFAIPVNMVAAVVRSSETGGKIVRPWSGADMQDVTAEIAESLGFDRPQGALIAQLHAASRLPGRLEARRCGHRRQRSPDRGFQARPTGWPPPPSARRRSHLHAGRQAPQGDDPACRPAGGPRTPGDRGRRLQSLRRHRRLEPVAGDRR